MKLTTLIAAVAATLVIAQNAEAREHYYRHGAYAHVSRHVYVHRDSAPRYFNSASSRLRIRNVGYRHHGDSSWWLWRPSGGLVRLGDAATGRQ